MRFGTTCLAVAFKRRQVTLTIPRPAGQRGASLKKVVNKMAKKYRVALFGISVDGESFKRNMAMLGVSGPILDKYIEKAPIVLKRDLRLEEARKYAEAIIDAGGLVHIQETGEFPDKPSREQSSIPLNQDFVLCPNCGFKQRKENSCVRCGFDLTTLH